MARRFFKGIEAWKAGDRKILIFLEFDDDFGRRLTCDRLLKSSSSYNAWSTKLSNTYTRWDWMSYSGWHIVLCVVYKNKRWRCSGHHTLKAQAIKGIRLLEDWHLKVEYLFLFNKKLTLFQPALRTCGLSNFCYMKKDTFNF